MLSYVSHPEEGDQVQTPNQTDYLERMTHINTAFTTLTNLKKQKVLFFRNV